MRVALAQYLGDIHIDVVSIKRWHPEPFWSRKSKIWLTFNSVSQITRQDWCRSSVWHNLKSLRELNLLFLCLVNSVVKMYETDYIRGQDFKRISTGIIKAYEKKIRKSISKISLFKPVCIKTCISNRVPYLHLYNSGCIANFTARLRKPKH
jgi:hypothetical protein